MPVGFRVFTQVHRPDPDLVARLGTFSSTDISDVMNKAGTMDPGIRPAYLPVKKVAGPAVTVSVPTGAQTIRAIGMQQAKAGDVLVFNGYGSREYAMIGGNFGRSLLNRGVPGVIIDGVFRDVSEFQEMELPVYSRGITTIAGPKDGPGEVNVPIACGHTVVNPGDIIIADQDGIVVIPPPAAEEVLAAVEKLTLGFIDLQDTLARGEIANIDSVERQLRAEGCEIFNSAATFSSE